MFSRWVNKTHVQNDTGENVVIKENGGNEDNWEDNSPQARFENQSGQTLIKQLGCGVYGTVFAAIKDADADRFLAEYQTAIANNDWAKKKSVIKRMRAHLRAAKILRDVRAQEPLYVSDFIREAILLQHFQDNSPEIARRGVMRIIDRGPDESPYYTMELITGGAINDLRQMFWKTPEILGNTIPAGLLWHMIAQLTQALLFLNFGIVNGKRLPGFQNMAHCDLHGGNILFRYPGQYGNFPDIVVADFGVAQLEPSAGPDTPVFLKRQIADIERICEWLMTFVSKADRDHVMLKMAYEKLDRVPVSRGNANLQNLLQGLLDFSKNRREIFYLDLPESWVQYFSRSAVSDDEFEDFLRRYQTMKAEQTEKNSPMKWLSATLFSVWRIQ